MQCYNGKTYVDIPESKLSDIGYTKYNITHSRFDCKIAYKRYLKVKEIEPVNVYYVTKDEKNEIEEPKNKLLYLCLLVIIIAVIWLIKIAVQKEPKDGLYSVVQKEPIKPKETVSVKKEPSKFWKDLIKYSEKLERTEQFKSWNDLSKEYSENLIKLEEERQKKEKAYFDAIVEKEQIKSKNNVNSVEQVKSKNNIIQKEIDKTFDDLPREYSENLRKIEEKRVKNGFYEIPKSKPAYIIIKNKPFNNFLDKTKTAYELLLERSEWKAYRLAVLAERGEKCEWCGSDKNLHVHHKFYLKYPNGKHILPWEYNINCLLVLCKDCHTKAHKNYKIKSYYVSY